MSAFIIFYTDVAKHIDELKTGIVEDLGFQALGVNSYQEFISVLGRKKFVAAVIDLSTLPAPKSSITDPSEHLSFRKWAANATCPVLILSDDADLAETEPHVTWRKYSSEMATTLAPLVARLRRIHQTGLDSQSSQLIAANANDAASTQEVARSRDLDLDTSSVVDSSTLVPLSILTVGELPKVVGLLRRKFKTVIQVSQLDEVRRWLKILRPQAILVAQEVDRFECVLDTIRMSEVTRHTSIAILGDGSTFAHTLSRSPTLLFQQNTPPAYIVEQLSFGARVALIQTPSLLLIAEEDSEVPNLDRPDGGAVRRCTPREIENSKFSVDLVVLAQSDYTTDVLEILAEIRQRFGVGIPILHFSGPDASEWCELVDGILNPADSPEEHSRTIDVFASFSRARSQISERDDLTGSNHWCGFRHSLSRRLIHSAERMVGISLLGVEIERFSEILSKHNTMHDTILRYVSDHLWQFFPKNATFRGPEGRFFVICDPISESNFRKIKRHLDSISSTTLRDPNGHGLYLRLHAAHLKVPPGILSTRICVDSIVRMFSRMRVRSGATFLSAELDTELVGAPHDHQGES